MAGLGDEQLWLKSAKGYVDNSVNAHTITNSGTTISGGYVFDGVDDKILVDTEWSTVTGGASFAVSFWINTTDSTADLIGDFESGVYPFIVRVDSSKLQIYRDLGLVHTSVTSIDTGVWLHVTVAYDGTNYSTYINGVLDIGPTAGGVPGTAGANELRLGYSSGSARWYAGTMDDVRIFNRALSLSEIKRLYVGGIGYNPLAKPRQLEGTVLQLNAGTNTPFEDESHYVQGITNNGVTVSSGAYVFDGSSSIDAVDVPLLTTSSGFSFSVWVNRDSGNMSLVSKAVAATQGEWYAIFASDKLYFRCVDHSTGGYIGRASGTNDVPTSTMTHVAGVYDGGATDAALTIYVNGVAVSTTSESSGSFTAIEDTSYAVKLGEREAGNRLSGTADDFRVINRALTAEEVETIYLQGRAARPFGLLGGEVLALEASRTTPTTDQILHLTGDGGYVDLAAAGHTVVNGGTSIVNGHFDFDEGEIITVTDAADFRTTSELTFAFDMNADAGTGYILAKNDDGGAHNFYVYWAGGGILNVALGSGSVAVSSAVYTATADWHVTITCKDNEVVFYKDGVFVNKSTVAAFGATNTIDLTIGNRTGGTSSGTKYGGTLNNIRIYDRILTHNEIVTLTGKLIDESYSGNHGTLTNGASVSGSEISVASLAYVDLGMDALGPDLVGAAAVSAVATFNLTSLGTIPMVVASYLGSGANNLNIRADGVDASTYKIRIGGRSQNADSYQSYQSTTIYDFGTEYHVVGVLNYGTGNIYLYVDGVLEGSGSATFGQPSYVHTTSVTLRDRVGEDDAADVIVGTVKDVRVFNRALTDAEVAYLAQSAEKQTPNSLNPLAYWSPSAQEPATVGKTSTSLIDLAPWSINNGVLTNMAPASDWVDDATNRGKLALDFDGSNDFVKLPNLLIGAGWSVVAWVKFSVNTGTSFGFAKRDPQRIYLGQKDGFAHFRAGTDAGSLGGATAIATGQWYCLALTIAADGLSYEGFVDGVSVGSQATTMTTSVGTAIGAYYNGTTDIPNNPLTGVTDDVQVYNRALTPAEITNLASRRNAFLASSGARRRTQQQLITQ